MAAGRAAVALVLVLLVGLGDWTWHSARPVQPADTHGSAHLPDRFYIPSSWMHTFKGPPGPLVAIGIWGQDSLLHSHLRVYGVTASGGAYGFLDLPAFVDGSMGSGPSSVLSPDGTSIAYWETGSVPGKPFAGSFNAPVVGVGVYDTESGTTRSTRIPSAHGLDPRGLAWSDDHTLVISTADIANQHGGDYSSRGDAPLVWRLEDASPSSLGLPAGEDFGNNASGPGFVVSDDNRVVWPRDRSKDVRFRAPTGSTAPLVAVSPAGDLVATVPGSTNPNRLLVGRIPSSPGRKAPRVTLRTVSNDQTYFMPVSWINEHHLAAVRRAPTSEGPPGIHLDLVDVDTGESHTLVSRFDAGFGSVSLATGLLGSPVVHATPPPHPWDQRWVLGGGALCLVIGVLYLWGARRGRRA